MATATKTKKNKNTAGHRSSGSTKKHKKNPGSKGHRSRSRSVARRSNPGIGPSVNTALFTIAGAVGSKLGAQALLGARNTGLMGYAGNAGVGFALYLMFSKLFKNREAAQGIMYGTLVQIILRAINDYTPFGQYVASLGMGDYQMQSLVTPQVLVDPMRDATLANGWNPPMPPLLPASPANAAAANGGGVAGLGGNIYSLGARRGLYS